MDMLFERRRVDTRSLEEVTVGIGAKQPEYNFYGGEEKYKFWWR